MITIKDLQFTEQSHGGIGVAFKTRSRLTISIQAGSGLYSHPKNSDFNRQEDYTHFEVAIFNIKGDYVTNDWLNCKGDQVYGYASRALINAIIYQLER